MQKVKEPESPPPPGARRDAPSRPRFIRLLSPVRAAVLLGVLSAISWIVTPRTAFSLFAAEPGATTGARHAPATEDPRLPRVLIIGDSVSVGYTEEVRRLLAGKANVYRAAGNAGPSSSGVQNLAPWTDPTKGTWDVIHFNFGLHDIKRGSGGKDSQPYPTSDGRQVPLEAYERNLCQIVAAFRTTGAALVWCSTTPVPAGTLDPPRQSDDVVTYNKAARTVMEECGVAIDDLYAAALPRLAAIQLPQNVHFTKEGSEELAQQVAASIEAALPH